MWLSNSVRALTYICCPQYIYGRSCCTLFGRVRTPLVGCIPFFWFRFVVFAYCYANLPPHDRSLQLSSPLSTLWIRRITTLERSKQAVRVVGHRGTEQANLMLWAHRQAMNSRRTRRHNNSKKSWKIFLYVLYKCDVCSLFLSVDGSFVKLTRLQKYDNISIIPRTGIFWRKGQRWVRVMYLNYKPVWFYPIGWYKYFFSCLYFLFFISPL